MLFLRAALGSFDACPQISCVSALRPSPDFFTGFADLDMRNATGDFYRNVGLLLPGLDAGTDGGQT